MQFSVVIPAYNYGKTLPRALESVLAQEGEDFEALVINDGSTDNTRQVLADLHARHGDGFRSVTRNNSGPSATRNYGIRNTSGRWLIFLDSDDELEPDALPRLREAIRRHPGARMIVCGHTSVWANGNERYQGVDLKCAKLSREELFVAYLLKKAVAPSPSATAMRRDVFEGTAFPEMFRTGEDIPVFAHVFANHPCAFVDEPISRMHKHADSLRHNLRHVEAAGTRVVDAVFDPANVPPGFQKYKKAFAARRCLTLFRTFFIAGDRQRALRYYREALRRDRMTLLNFSHTRKALRCLLGKGG